MIVRRSSILNPHKERRRSKQFTDFDVTSSKVQRQMDRFVGKTANTNQWKSMKRKYSLSVGSTRTYSKMPLNPEIFIKTQEEQRKKYPFNEFSQILQPEIKKHVREKPSFFKENKQSLKYFEQSDPIYSKIKNQHKQKTKQYRNRSWYKLDKSHSKELDQKDDLFKKFQHPVLNLYNKTSVSVIASSRLKRKIKNPFDWFVSPFQLDDF